MSDTRTTLAASGGTLLAIVGALVIGAGLAGIITTATVDLAAFGSFAAFIELATPYTYAAGVALLVAGFSFVALGVALRDGRAYPAGLVATGVLALAGLVALLFADRLPLEPLVLIARGAGAILLLPVALLLLAYPGPARR
jgi:hypothetical protein